VTNEKVQIIQETLEWYRNVHVFQANFSAAISRRFTVVPFNCEGSLDKSLWNWTPLQFQSNHANLSIPNIYPKNTPSEDSSLLKTSSSEDSVIAVDILGYVFQISD